MVRSAQTRTESALTANADGQVSVGNELPGANGGDKAPAPKDATNKNEETTNYEISRVTKTEIAEGGRIKRLSVAVVVDGVYATAPDGKQTYSPRAPAEIERITALVRSAVGFDKARGALLRSALSGGVRRNKTSSLLNMGQFVGQHPQRARRRFAFISGQHHRCAVGQGVGCIARRKLIGGSTAIHRHIGGIAADDRLQKAARAFAHGSLRNRRLGPRG